MFEMINFDMADRQFDRKKWRLNVTKKSSNPIGNQTINQLYIYIILLFYAFKYSRLSCPPFTQNVLNFISRAAMSEARR